MVAKGKGGGGSDKLGAWDQHKHTTMYGLPWWLSDKGPTCQCRRHDNPLQYSRLRNPKERSLVGYSRWGLKSQTQLSDQITTTTKQPLCIKQINNKDFLYNTKNDIQYLVIIYDGKEYEKMYTYMYMYNGITFLYTRN